MLQIDWSSFLGLVAVALCWVLSVVLFRAGSTGKGSRKLAVLLVIEGFALITNVFYLYLLDHSAEAGWTIDDRVFSGLNLVHMISDCLMLVLYPAFLAVALNTKLTRPFKDTRLRMLLLGYSVVLFLAVQLSGRVSFEILLYASISLLFTYTLVASIHAWLTAQPGIVRDRARSFALAFSFRDICWGFVYAFTIFDILAGTYNTTNLYTWVDFIYRVSTLIYVPIIAYGILRTQLFDIDLRIRWTIKQSTVASVFIAVMFVVSEGASQFLSDELGAVTGLLAAGILMFFLAPLQRFAEGVASTAMPNTKNTPEYAMFRKMQVYESAMIEAHFEHGVSDRERALLNRLRDSLDISEADAEAIELELNSRPAT
jgi:hypothetical protein